MLATMVEVGQRAPQFSLPDADMESVELGGFVGKRNVVLYFYLKDGSPGCAAEAIEFTEAEGEFAKRNTIVLGVSADDCLSHAEFRDEHGISVTLLADDGGEVCQQYGVWVEREAQGATRHVVQRSTFVIDQRGIVRHALYGVTPRGHARQVLDLVDTL